MAAHSCHAPKGPTAGVEQGREHRALVFRIVLKGSFAEKGRRCPYVPETCMLVDGAYGNTVQQKKWANDAN